VKSRRILIVEDNALSLEATEKLLRAAGADVTGAANGEAALTRLELGGFDAVVLDLRMPGMDGLETLRAMRARGDRTPVLVASAVGSSSLADVLAESQGLGPVAAISKPFEVEELLDALRKLIRESQSP
jgi:CheY-like chemotaxis protein